MGRNKLKFLSKITQLVEKIKLKSFRTYEVNLESNFYIYSLNLKQRTIFWAIFEESTIVVSKITNSSAFQAFDKSDLFICCRSCLVCFIEVFKIQKLNVFLNKIEGFGSLLSDCVYIKVTQYVILFRNPGYHRRTIQLFTRYLALVFLETIINQISF